MVLGHLVEDLVEANANEVDEHQLHNRPEPRLGRADRHAYECRLRDRRIEDSLVTESPGEPPGCSEDAAEVRDILAEDDDGVVLLHLMREQLGDEVRASARVGHACWLGLLSHLRILQSGRWRVKAWR